MGKEDEPLMLRKVTLADVTSPRKEKGIPSASPDFPFIGLENIEAHTMRLLGTVPASTMRSNANRFYAGDVLYGRLRPYLNKVFVPGFDGYCSAEFIVFPKSVEINSKFLQYRLNAKDFLSFATHLNTGDRPRVDFSQISAFSILLPTPSEQHRIVAKIEELFSELDKGVEALKTAQQQLKVYRQAVLDSAVTGNDLRSLEEAVLSLDQGWSPRCDNQSSDNHRKWAVIKTTAVQARTFLEAENKRLPEELQPRIQHELEKGDLLITRAGPRVRAGVCCLVKHVRPRLLNCDKVYRIRVDSEIALPEYIEALLNSPTYSKKIDRMKTGINDSGVNLTQKGLLKTEIPLPPIEQQRRTVQEIESRLSVADKIEESISQSLKQAEALRQSILKKAFSGKLVPQDPNDEPAEKLLARIRAEKGAQTLVKGPARRKGPGRKTTTSPRPPS